MPEDTDEKELGSAPTAITSVVGEVGGRNKQPTQTLAMQGEDPAWAGGTLPPSETLESTEPSGRALAPRLPLRERLRKLFNRTQHERKKVPSTIRVAAPVAGSLGLAPRVS